MTSPTAAERLGDFCAGLVWADLPAEVRERTVQFVLDLVGVAISGAGEPSSRPVRTATAAAPADPARGASAIGVPGRVVPPTAALVNGTSGHAIELDDVHRASSLHPGVVVIPAALAVAEDCGSTGKALLEAVVAGYEVVIRVGDALGPASTYARGFHPTGVAGAFGAAAASAKLLGADGVTIGRAIAIAGTMASGSMEYLADGSWTKRLNAGWAGHVGVTAAELAVAGFTGPRSALEGSLGALRAYTDAPQPGRLTDDRGAGFEIMRVAIKPYASCRYNHGLIDGVLRLAAEHDIDRTQVARMRLGVLSAGAALVAEPIERKRAPANPVDAQFSAPYAAAIALVHGAAGAAQYRQDVIDDAAIRELMAITDCYRSADLDADYPARWPAAVEIEMTDGRVLETRVEFAYGEPENPVSANGLRAKFRDLARGGLDLADVDCLETLILGLHEAASVRPIGDVLRAVRVT